MLYKLRGHLSNQIYSWNRTLMRERGTAMGAEFKGKGGMHFSILYQMLAVAELLHSARRSGPNDESHARSRGWAQLGGVSSDYKVARALRD